jgi:hypothetical protein
MKVYILLSFAILARAALAAGSECQDMVFTWRDAQGNPCQNYQDYQLCTTDGDYGPAWDLSTFGTFESFAWGGLDAAQV